MLSFPILRKLFLGLSASLLLSCSERSDNIQLTCDQTPDTASCRSSRAEETKKQLNLCFDDICNKNNDFISMSQINKTAEKRELYRPNTSLYKKVEEAVVAKVNTSKKSSLKILDTINHYLGQKSITVTNKQKAAYNRSFLINFYLNSFNQERPNKITESFIPSDEYFKKMDIQEEDVNWLKDIFATNSFKGLPQYFLPRYYGVAFLKEDYPELPLQKAIRKAATDCLNIHQRIKNKLGIPFPAFDIARSGICKHVLNNPHSIINMNIFTRQVQNAKILNFFFKDELDHLLERRDFDINKILFGFTKTQLFNLANTYKKVNLEKNLSIKNQIRQAINSCHTIIGNAYETAPSKTQKRKAQNSIELIKKMTKEKFYFSNVKMNRFFKSEIDRIDFQFPLFHSDYERNVIDIFSIWLNDLRKMDTINDHESMLTAILVLSIPLHIKRTMRREVNLSHGIASLQQINGLCAHFKSRTFGDHYYTGTGTAYISWNAIKYLDIGFGIIAHEIGHAVSSTLVKMIHKWPGNHYGGLSEIHPLWERRSCINKFHRNTPLINTGEKQYTEEDWADHYSATIINDYKGQDIKPRNYACSLIVDLLGTLHIGLENPKSDAHSAATFRALHVHKTLNKDLPASCNKAIKVKEIPTCF